jgi:hypothetical protein
MPPIRTRFRLIPPFVQGDGVNFSDVKLFVEMIQGEIHTGDLLRVQGHTFYTSWTEFVKDADYLEEYIVVTVKLISNNAAGFPFKLNIHDPTECIVLGSAQMH